MLITTKVRFRRVLKATWKDSLRILIVCLLSYLFNEYFLSNYFEFPAFIDAILGTALAFFIGFNNNQAYDRWWEARKIWGSLVNDSRTWVRQLKNYPVTNIESEQEELKQITKRMVFRHISFLYALKRALRGESSKQFSDFISKEEYEEVASKSNIQNAILDIQSRDLMKIRDKGWIDGFGFITMNKLLVAFCDQMGMSERIKNTVFPPTYNHYTRLFIWFLIVSSTFVMGNQIGAWSILFGFLLGYVFLITNTIGLKLLNPFEPIATGIPLDQITRTIEINLIEILGDGQPPEPITSVDEEYIM